MDQAEKQFLDKLIKVTEVNLSDESFGVFQLAREMGINRSGLYRKVKLLTKKSISQFIREQRLKKAMELLKENSLNISEIAYATGFGSVAYFSKCFHQFYGCQPVEARKRLFREINIEEGEDDIQKIDILKKEPAEGIERIPQRKSLISDKHILIPVAGVLIFVVIIIAILSLNRFHENSIGILPFTNDSKDSANVYFNNGIAEAIRDRLANIRALEVKSRMTTDLYKYETTKSLRRIARQMGVRYIVEGSSQKSGDEVLITVQLIEARKDKHLFSRQYEKKYEDVFSLYGEIALDVAEKIRAVITPEEKKMIIEQLPENLEALRWIITGQSYLDLIAKNTGQNNELRNQAEASYRKVILLDSVNSDALAGLGRICLNKNDNDSAMLLAEKALQYNTRNLNAYLLKSDIYIIQRMPSEAERNLKLVLKYDPGHLWAHFLLGGVYYSKGEFQRSFEYLIKTRELLGNLDPSFSQHKLLQTEWNTLHLARSLFALGFYKEGKKYALQWFKLSNDHPWGYNYNLFAGGIINRKFEEVYQLGLTLPEENLCLYYMGMNLLFLGKNKEALDYFLKIQETERLNGRYYHRIHHLKAFAFSKTGDQTNAEKYFKLSEFYVDTLLAAHPNYIKTEIGYGIMDRFWRSPMFIRTANAAVRGENEKALGYLRELRNNYPASDLQVVTFLKLFPMFDNIRNEPEFQDYLREAENHYLSERQKVEKLLKEEGIIQ